MSPWNLSGKLAVVTGAGSGIGAALARSLAGRGAHLALADIDAEGLEATRSAIRRNVRVSLHPMDVRDTAAVDALPAAVATEHGAPADMLINNAGVALEGEFVNVSEADFDWVLAINLHAPIRLTRAFLPGLLERPRAQIVNVSSVFGLIGPPGQTAYSTAKFGLRGFTEALRKELQGSPVRVAQVHPGGIATDIARNMRLTSDLSDAEEARRLERAQKFLKMPPDRAADIILRGVERGRDRILIGNDARAIDVVQRLMPVRHWSVLRRYFGG